ncbi:MAG TPA: hypothetical protein VH309_06665, partial [Elusimicrobiota bacterium]|nr:hypothetical protein [Elusimicrobiota bacterium]
MAEKMEEQELLIVHDTPSRSTEGAGKMIRVVRWRVDGKLGEAGIVKQSYYTAKTERRTGKNEMLKAADFSAIKTKWAE